jgi:hypothetical protein
MGRPQRLALGGYVYHVLNRANGRLPIFQKEADYAAFQRILREALEHVPEKERGRSSITDTDPYYPFSLEAGDDTTPAVH